MSEDIGSERVCTLCGAAVGHGKFRPKRLKCRNCEKTVCPSCSTQQPEGVTCRQCIGRPSDVGTEDLLASAKDILADIKAKQALQARAQASERRAEILNTSNSIIEKYQSQILAYDAEIQDMKKQIDWYADQLDRREQTIQQMTAQMAVLANSNHSLDERINALEGLLGSLPRPEEAKPGECVRCLLF